MAWNEPGKGKDPWGGGNRNNKGGGPPDLDQIWKRFRKRLGGSSGGGGGGGGGGVGGGLVLGGIVVAALIWLATGMYIVQPGEQGVLLRLGRYVHTVKPGWHWHLPYPISDVLKVDTQQVRRASNRAVMLTKDENIVDVEISVQYRVSNALNYLFKLQDPDQTVQQVLRSAVREVVGTSDMNQVIQEGVQVNQLDDKALSHVDLKQNAKQSKPNGSDLKDFDKKLAGQVKQKQSQYPKITHRSRAELPSNVRRIMQYTLDQYDSGIKILAVNVQYAQPPEPVQGAFQEAIKAREEEERSKNIARAYARDILARAQGEKAQMVARAKGYEQRKINRAEGQAARFSDLLTQYQKAPQVTHERLYLETMGDVLSSTHLVLSDGSSNSTAFLPLSKLLEKTNKGAKSSSGSQSGGSSSSSPSGGGSSGGSGDSSSTSSLPPMSGSNGGSGNASGINVQSLRSRSRNS